MKKWMGIMALLLANIVLPAYAEQPMTGMQMQGKTAQASHQGRGKVVAVDRTKPSVKLAHEEIKSLGWSAMTMEFGVTKPALVEGLKAGDAVTFELAKDGKTGKWLLSRITPAH